MVAAASERHGEARPAPDVLRTDDRDGERATPRSPPPRGRSTAARRPRARRCPAPVRATMSPRASARTRAVPRRSSRSYALASEVGHSSQGRCRGRRGARRSGTRRARCRARERSPPRARGRRATASAAARAMSHADVAPSRTAEPSAALPARTERAIARHETSSSLRRSRTPRITGPPPRHERRTAPAKTAPRRHSDDAVGDRPYRVVVRRDDDHGAGVRGGPGARGDLGARGRVEVGGGLVEEEHGAART